MRNSRPVRHAQRRLSSEHPLLGRCRPVTNAPFTPDVDQILGIRRVELIA